MAASKTTTNHDEIRRWVEKNGGSPARVKATGSSKGDPGILRIDYPGFSGKDTLQKMDWDAWFEAFDANKLAFVYSPSTRFSKLVARTTTARRTATAGRRSPGGRGRATGAKKTASRTPKRATTARRSPKKRATKTTAKRTTKRSTKKARSKA